LKRYEALYSTSSIPQQGMVFGSRLDFSFIFIRGPVEAITGYQEREFLAGKPRWEEIIHPDDQSAVRHGIAGLGNRADGVTHQEYRIIHKDGKIRWVRGFIQNIADACGKPAFLEGAIFDITSQREALRELCLAQKLEALRVFAGGMAHDFNNLMTVILGGLSLALLDQRISVKTSKVLNEANKACHCAMRLTQELINASSGGELPGRVESLREILDAAVHDGLSGSPVPCRVLAAEDLWPVRCDAQQAQRAIENVLRNAREAIHNGGSIQITATNVRLGEGQVPLLKSGNYVRISVQDNGVGIPEEHLPRVFDPYFSTKSRGSDKGMGLGLAISYSILKRHEGHIQVESGVGVGTPAHLYFPSS